MDDYQHTSKGFFPRIKGYHNTLSVQMGIIDYDQGWDNEYSKFRAIVKLIKNTLVSVKKKRTILVPKDFEFNWQAIHGFDRVWAGGCTRVVVREPEERRFMLKENPLTKNPFFDSTKKFLELVEKDKLEIDQIHNLPDYNRLTPLGKIGEQNRWGVQTRVGWATKIVWEGVEWATIINDGHFTHLTKEGLIPKVTKDKYLTNDKSWVFSNDNYFRITHDYDMYLNDQWAEIQDDFQYLIDHNQDSDNFSFLEKIGIVPKHNENNPYEINVEEKIKEIQDASNLDIQ